MMVCVDETRHHQPVSRVDDLDIIANREASTDLPDQAVFDQDIAAAKVAQRGIDRNDPTVTYERACQSRPPLIYGPACCEQIRTISG
jgi:hypothetical protein